LTKLLLDFNPEPVAPSTVTTRKDIKGFAVNDDYYLYLRDKQQVLLPEPPIGTKLDDNILNDALDP